MRCSRCGGLMTREAFTDLLDSMERVCDGWRCVNCGEIIDAVVMRNRTRPDLTSVSSKRRWTKVLAA